MSVVGREEMKDVTFENIKIGENVGCLATFREGSPSGADQVIPSTVSSPSLNHS